MSAKLRDAPIEEPQLLGDGRKRYMVHGSSFEVPIHYNVLKAVGYGAYGLVCSALNTETNEKVAIKKMPKVFDDLVDGKRILREIKILTYLNHENIIGIKDVFRPRNKQFDDIYYVADLMESDLHQIIRSKQKLSDEHYQYFIYQVLRALKYIHSGEILHRDLKPGNLLVNGNCDLRVCDFGLARGFDPNELTDYVVTRWYRPPELLLMAVEYGPAVDVWSAGCIFAELMNRKPLFPGRDYINQLNLITDVLGVPTEEDVQTIKSQEAVRYLKSMSKKTPVAMAELFPSCTNRLAIEFLDSMLTFNPAKRVTATQALSHPYLAQLHDPADEPTCPNVFSWKYDSQELKENELRSLFWEEIVKFHPDDEKK